MSNEPEHNGEPVEPVPEIEDAYEPETKADEPVVDDDPALLGPESRSLEVEAGRVDAGEPAAVSEKLTADDTSDAGAVVDESGTTGAPVESHEPDWANERSAHRIAVELKRIESSVRELLQAYDTKRKRRLAGTRRWMELEEDLMNWRFMGRVDEETLDRLHAMIAKRHFLFTRLRYVSETQTMPRIIPDHKPT